MKEREGQKYVIKIFEAQWDEHYDTSVKPFFEQLKRETTELERVGRHYRRHRMGNDALYKYRIFQTAEGLKVNITEKDKGVGDRKKIGYFACHGRRGAICAVNDISRTKLRNIVSDLTSYDGLFFGACDFVDPDNAKYFLDNCPHLKWIAGYGRWIPWLEGTLNDLLFFKILLSGSFSRPTSKAQWKPASSPEKAAEALYTQYVMADDLKFSLYYRVKNGVRSTLGEWQTLYEEFVDDLPPHMRR
jgi:hypothetical protein